MRLNTLATLGISGAFGVLAIFLARGWINDAVNSQYEQNRTIVKLPPAKKMKTVPVLVADTNLQFGDRLSQQNVRLVDYPMAAVPEGSFTGYDQLFKNAAHPPLVLTQMAQNEPLLAFKLSSLSGRATLSARISENMRAVSIRVNDVSGVAGFVQPGDAVDVFLTQEYEVYTPRTAKRRLGERREDSYFKTDLLLQNARILAADQSAKTVEGKVRVVKTVTLEVTHKQAQKLTLGMKVGDLSLSLRHAGSTENLLSASMSLKDLGGQKPRINHVARRAKTPSVQMQKDLSGVANVTVMRNGEYDKALVFKEKEPEAKLAGGEL